jgi:hypothetical protein
MDLSTMAMNHTLGNRSLTLCNTSGFDAFDHSANRYRLMVPVAMTANIKE